MALPLGLSHRRVHRDAELERLTLRLSCFVMKVSAKRFSRGDWSTPPDRV
jgi:hypothetical protein